MIVKKKNGPSVDQTYRDVQLEARKLMENDSSEKVQLNASKEYLLQWIKGVRKTLNKKSSVKSVGQRYKVARTANCSHMAINQKKKSCFFVAVMLLIIKTPYLYDQLQAESRKYVDTIRTSSTVDQETCAAIPKKIGAIYAKIKTKKSSSKKGNFIDINKHGGNSLLLLQALLMGNKISYRMSLLDPMSNFKRQIKEILDERQQKVSIIKVQVNFISFKETCKKIINAQTTKFSDYTLSGGFIHCTPTST